MLSQLDDAIDRGEVWVAYQPKLDLATKRIIGAEALARWTHPEKGPIAASEFVAAAEQRNRIGKLTDFVLEKAVARGRADQQARDRFRHRGQPFGAAADRQGLHAPPVGLARAARPRAGAADARAHRDGSAGGQRRRARDDRAPARARRQHLDRRLRHRPVDARLSEEDPANEIKIDQSFVKSMADNRSDRLMVQSTIGLAHSLGRKVVAEGVEHRDILDLLVEMGCDVAQGFAIGRPMSIDSLTKRLSTDRKRTAA